MVNRLKNRIRVKFDIAMIVGTIRFFHHISKKGYCKIRNSIPHNFQLY